MCAPPSPGRPNRPRNCALPLRAPGTPATAPRPLIGTCGGYSEIPITAATGYIREARVPLEAASGGLLRPYRSPWRPRRRSAPVCAPYARYSPPVRPLAA